MAFLLSGGCSTIWETTQADEKMTAACRQRWPQFPHQIRTEVMTWDVGSQGKCGKVLEHAPKNIPKKRRKTGAIYDQTMDMDNHSFFLAELLVSPCPEVFTGMWKRTLRGHDMGATRTFGEGQWICNDLKWSSKFYYIKTKTTEKSFQNSSCFHLCSFLSSILQIQWLNLIKSKLKHGQEQPSDTKKFYYKFPDLFKGLFLFQLLGPLYGLCNLDKSLGDRWLRLQPLCATAQPDRKGRKERGDDLVPRESLSGESFSKFDHAHPRRMS